MDWAIFHLHYINANDVSFLRKKFIQHTDQSTICALRSDFIMNFR